MVIVARTRRKQERTQKRKEEETRDRRKIKVARTGRKQERTKKRRKMKKQEIEGTSSMKCNHDV